MKTIAAVAVSVMMLVGTFARVAEAQTSAKPTTETCTLKVSGMTCALIGPNSNEAAVTDANCTTSRYTSLSSETLTHDALASECNPVTIGAAVGAATGGLGGLVAGLREGEQGTAATGALIGAAIGTASGAAGGAVVKIAGVRNPVWKTVTHALVGAGVWSAGGINLAKEQ